MNYKKGGTLGMALAAMAFSTMAQADGHGMSGYYVSLGYGIVEQDDSSNDGTFTSDFTTGTDTTVPIGPALIPAGSPVGWETEFDQGDNYSLAFGKRFGQWRLELAYVSSSTDVDSHAGVNAAGLALDGVDAAILITGATDLGITTGALVSDGQGSIESDTWMVSAYYDFDLGWPVTPFVGLGFGTSDVDVDYSPSNTVIIDDDDTVTVYQIVLGLSYAITDQWHVQFNYTQWNSDDVEVDATLLPASFDIENDSDRYNLGLTYNF
ncbi:MAG: hypothetical protein AseanaTS_00640 [Candidatus Pelagadaptatus aseana]|uniref:outer membrane protein n=1 Tax=Candidatus Pelagadaptatus aseana TaxID=3120508 RepID=UPI0039B3238D